MYTTTTSPAGAYAGSISLLGGCYQPNQYLPATAAAGTSGALSCTSCPSGGTAPAAYPKDTLGAAGSGGAAACTSCPAPTTPYACCGSVGVSSCSATQPTCSPFQVRGKDQLEG